MIDTKDYPKERVEKMTDSEKLKLIKDLKRDILRCEIACLDIEIEQCNKHLPDKWKL